VREAVVDRGDAEGLVDLAGPGDFGQRDGLGHLHVDPLRSGRGGFKQPGPRAGADAQELCLRLGPGHGFVVAGHLFLVVREVFVQDRRGTRPGECVAGDLDRPAGADVHDHDLRVRAGPVEPGEHLSPEQMGRHGVLGVFEGDHGRVFRHPAPDPIGESMGCVRNAVQGRGLLGEHVDRAAAGDAVLARVDLVHERRAGRLEFGERGVGVPQVGVFGHQVCLGDLHG
jgi:hypothetical protein